MEIDIQFQQEIINAITKATASKGWTNSPVFVALVAGFIGIISAFLANIFNNIGQKNRDKAEITLKELELENRKKESVLELQISALKRLTEINHSIFPVKWDSPEGDISDAYKDVVFNMERLLYMLDKYLKDYTYILPPSVTTPINKVVNECNISHWGVSLAQSPEYEPTKGELDSAESAINSLYSAIENFKKELSITKKGITIRSSTTRKLALCSIGFGHLNYNPNLL